MRLADARPVGFLKWIFRAPIVLFRLRLGWLLTDHFLMVTTTGRKSGLPRYAVVEVLQRDKANQTYIAASGWGVRSDWDRNIQKDPQVRLDVGFKRGAARAAILPDEQAALVLADYARRFPKPFRMLAKTLTGDPVTGTPEECLRLVKQAPLVAFTLL